MSAALQNFVWHRSLGALIAKLNSPMFWGSLVQMVNEHVAVDTWVALIFSAQQAQVLCFRESTEENERVALTKDYVQGLFLLDPFYIANRENPHSGFFHLKDIAPVFFEKTEYYKKYFSHYVSADEVQYNVTLDNDRTLCLSLGSRIKFSQENIAIFDLIRPWVMALMEIRMCFETSLDGGNSQPHKWQGIMEQMDNLLTTREMEILKLLFSGFSNRQVAEKLLISVETVRAHRRNLYTKLNIKSQSEFFALFFNL
ncbi:LuxR family transcriptional regulator [Pseudomonas sp. BRG-100]|uniref:helix-turn-helix domain-containing protein n=1 Tax=Pseudomonas sp. BRG-100 TaxID=1524267 RepID=UPI0004E6359F|nr:helix-turn-helix transcriptional regulator [Pseudomonas sp. BRG-100]KFF42170.1 LuxR family transcriptional regulator [Pseudomonas sp. BRG-100]